MLEVPSAEPLVLASEPVPSPVPSVALVVGFGFGIIGFGVVDSTVESDKVASADFELWGLGRMDDPPLIPALKPALIPALVPLDSVGIGTGTMSLEVLESV